MKNIHLTQKELIEYKFALASQKQSSETAEHLEGCERCRKALEVLERKFSALDLLKDKPELTEELVAKVLADVQSAGPKKSRMNLIPAWLAAAATILFVSSLFFALQFNGPTEPEEETPVVTSRPGGTIEQDLARPKREEFAYQSGQQEKAASAIHGLKGLAESVMESEKPPFAPASAIELVVLPRRENVQITIYNSADLTLVREKRNLTLKKGWNWLQFMWANTLIDPTSLNLEPLEHKGEVRIEQLVFPPRLRELGRWLIKSDYEGLVPFEITYFTSGLSWRAFYMGTLSEDEKKMELKSYVRVTNNSGEDYENAQTRLIVGKVHLLDEIANLARRQWPYGSPIQWAHGAGMGGFGGRWGGGYVEQEVVNGPVPLLGDESVVGGVFVQAWYKPKEIIKEGLSEYFLYTIEGTETIENQWAKRLISFEANNIDVNSLYKYDEDRYGAEAARFVSFVNDEKHNLGETPIPNGSVKIFGLADSEGYLSYVGGADTKYIPVNEEVELNLGHARLVKVEPKLMSFATENYIYDGKGNITGWDEVRTWEITVTNTKNIPVDVEITRNFNTAYWDLDLRTSNDIDYEKLDATRGRFNLKVGPQSTKQFEYVLRTYHEKRIEDWKE